MAAIFLHCGLASLMTFASAVDKRELLATNPNMGGLASLRKTSARMTSARS